MKKLIALLLALVMVFAMCAYGNTEPEKEPENEANNESANTNEITTLIPGTLTVATSPDFAPYEFYALDEDGNAVLAGFEVALAQYIADYCGLKLEIIPMDFDGTLEELQKGSVDLGMAGYSPKPEREEIMDFSDVFYTGGQSFVCLKGNEDKFKSLEDLNNADLSVGAQVGSIQVDLANEFSADADIVELVKVTDIIAEILDGKLDGGYIETAVAKTYAVNYPDLCVVLDVPYDAEGSVVGVNKGNEALLKAVNEAINKALSDGSMDKFVAEANELAAGEIYEGLLESEG